MALPKRFPCGPSVPDHVVENIFLHACIMTLDAASLPSPPNFAPWKNPDRLHSSGGMQSGVERNGRSGSHQNGNHASSRIPRFPNIKDLQDEAASLDVSESTAVRVALFFFDSP